MARYGVRLENDPTLTPQDYQELKIAPTVRFTFLISSSDLTGFFFSMASLQISSSLLSKAFSKP